MSKGQCSFPVQAVVAGNASAEQKSALASALTSMWNYYLHQDRNGYCACLTPDVTRLSQRTGAIQQGRDLVAAGLPTEWQAFERSKGTITEQMKVRRAELHIEQTSGQLFATVLYWVEVEGGGRWDYSDQGLVFQVLVFNNQQWQTAHYVDAWSLDYDLDSQQPGDKPTFEFDFVYPVKDLSRAVDFYTPLLGEPEAVSATHAAFNLRGARFILDTLACGGHAHIKNQLPNGYARFYVENIAADYARLKDKGVPWVGGVQQNQQDQYALGFDPAQNLFMLWQKDFNAPGQAPPPAPTGLNDNQPFVQATRAIATAWLTMDTHTLGRYYGSAGRWFDDTRLKIRGQERGQAAINTALRDVYWPHYDRTTHGIAAKMEVSQLRVRPLGAGAVVSYELRLSGLGSHPFRDRALVTHLFENPTSVAYTFICASNASDSMVLELDYTGYPVVDLEQAKHFYRKILQLGEGYDDEDYYGYWSNNAVFGLYVTDPEEDNLPQPRKSNGYASFWIRSADQTYAYLKQQGCDFPLVPAINDKRGIDAQPGYRQVVATDSEGNLLICTEYTGRIK